MIFTNKQKLRNFDKLYQNNKKNVKPLYNDKKYDLIYYQDTKPHRELYHNQIIKKSYQDYKNNYYKDLTQDEKDSLNNSLKDVEKKIKYYDNERKIYDTVKELKKEKTNKNLNKLENLKKNRNKLYQNLDYYDRQKESNHLNV